MIYIVFEQWDETGPSPVAVEELDNKKCCQFFYKQS